MAQKQTAKSTISCGGCCNQIQPGEQYYFHLTGMVECVDCYEFDLLPEAEKSAPYIDETEV